jgi:hypothetical protein
MTVDGRHNAKPNAYAIMQIAAREAGLTLSEMRGSEKTPSVSRVRNLAMYLARRQGIAVGAIAAVLDKPDGAVRKGARRAEAALRAGDPDLARLAAHLLERIEGWRPASAILVPPPAAEAPPRRSVTPAAGPMVCRYPFPDKAGRVRVSSLVRPTPAEKSAKVRHARSYTRSGRVGP